MQNHINLKHVGLDVHAQTIDVALADERGPGSCVREVRRYGKIANRPDAVRKLVRDLSKDGSSLQFWYEAGPTGFDLYRQLRDLEQPCVVVAPSLIPRRAGDRVKTDRRDASMLARLGRAGELTAVWVPGPEQEAMRDLSRCREDAKQMQRRARQQLNAFLLRHGRHYDAGKRRWTLAFFDWLSKQTFESPVPQMVFQDYVHAVEMTTRRLEALDAHLEQTARAWSRWPIVQSLMALPGVNLVTAIGVLAELGDLTRFDSPRQLMAFLGLVPSEHSSGQSRRQGGITKTGNTHVRRLLVESSWSYRHPARKTAYLKRKAAPAPAVAQDLAWKAQKRLCSRYRHLVDRGKSSTQACTAVARELSGFIWAIVRAVSTTDRSDDDEVNTSRRCGGCSTPLGGAA